MESLLNEKIGKYQRPGGKKTNLHADAVSILFDKPTTALAARSPAQHTEKRCSFPDFCPSQLNPVKIARLFDCVCGFDRYLLILNEMDNVLIMNLYVSKKYLNRELFKITLSIPKLIT